MSSNVFETVLATNYKFVRVVIDMQIGSEHHDIVCVSKDFGHLLQRNAFGFREIEVEEDASERADDNEELDHVSKKKR